MTAFASPDAPSCTWDACSGSGSREDGSWRRLVRVLPAADAASGGFERVVAEMMMTTRTAANDGAPAPDAARLRPRPGAPPGGGPRSWRNCAARLFASLRAARIQSVSEEAPPGDRGAAREASESLEFGVRRAATTNTRVRAV